MKKLTFIAALVLTFLLVPTSIKAEVKLPAIVSSNMVLQRNTNVVLWGWADANEKINITTSWSKEVKNIQADAEGNWRISVKTTNSLEPQTIKIKSDASTITLDNILFGEVWLCSGQSNMLRQIKGKAGQPVFGSLMTIAKANNPNLRLFNVDFNHSNLLLKDVKKYIAWQAATPANVGDFSAVGYYFGQQLQEILGCPVGIINSSVGGSAVETWMSEESFSPFKKPNVPAGELKVTDTPNVLFNAMIKPLTSFTIKGVLWYQGEANKNEPDNYKKLFPEMVKDWRKLWNIGDFPFYYVQIAPFASGNPTAFKAPDNSAYMREAQLQCLDLIPNSAMAVTLDIGEEKNIHPPKKKEVADRLLFIALNKTYGFSTVDCETPIYKSQEVKEGGLLLSFKNAESGLYAYNELADFEIAGDNKVFYPAKASIVQGKLLLVSSPKVPNPVAVRYGWSKWVLGTLYGANLLPASSFRTDTWDEATRAE